MVLFTPRQSTYVCIRHHHIYFIDMTTNCQINRSFIKGFDKLFFCLSQDGCVMQGEGRSVSTQNIYMYGHSIKWCWCHKDLFLVNFILDIYIYTISAICGSNITHVSLTILSPIHGQTNFINPGRHWAGTKRIIKKYLFVVLFFFLKWHTSLHLYIYFKIILMNYTYRLLHLAKQL